MVKHVKILLNEKQFCNIETIYLFSHTFNINIVANETLFNIIWNRSIFSWLFDRSIDYRLITVVTIKHIFWDCNFMTKVLWSMISTSYKIRYNVMYLILIILKSNLNNVLNIEQTKFYNWWIHIYCFKKIIQIR